MSKNLLFSLIHFLFFLPSFAFQDKNDTISLQLTSLFSDHMVLQQKSNVKFWGTDKPNNEITISTSWENESKTIVDINGHWNVSIGTPSAGGPFKIEIKSNQHKIVLNDIMIGEVWLASGQSNMEMTLMGWPPNDIINNADEEIAKSSNSKIRMFNVEKQISINPYVMLKGAGKFQALRKLKILAHQHIFLLKNYLKNYKYL